VYIIHSIITTWSLFMFVGGVSLSLN